MLKELKFCMGAVSRKDFIPALTHFHIANGFVTGYNGRIAIRSPIALDLLATPKADQFIKAVETCKQEAALHMTPAGRLAISSGKFKANIECTTEVFPDVSPCGQRIPITEGFLNALSTLENFTAEDASRRWANGVLFRNKSVFATNNIVLIEYWLGYKFPCEVNLPATTVRELLRIGEDPVALQLAEQSVTFHYSGDRWLHSVLYDTQWPDPTRVLDRLCNAVPVPPQLFEAARTLKPFVSEGARLFLHPGKLTTETVEGIGAEAKVEGLNDYACFNVNQLLMLEGVAKQIDFSQYPAPVLFFGDSVRGAITGMRV